MNKIIELIESLLPENRESLIAAIAKARKAQKSGGFPVRDISKATPSSPKKRTPEDIKRVHEGLIAKRKIQTRNGITRHSVQTNSGGKYVLEGPKPLGKLEDGNVQYLLSFRNPGEDDSMVISLQPGVDDRDKPYYAFKFNAGLPWQTFGVTQTSTNHASQLHKHVYKEHPTTYISRAYDNRDLLAKIAKQLDLESHSRRFLEIEAILQEFNLFSKI